MICLWEHVSSTCMRNVRALSMCGSLAEKEQVVFVDKKPVRLESLQKGKAIHAEAWVKGYEPDVFVGSSLISMYSKCGTIEDAQHVFDRSLQKNVVSWNAMLAGYSQQSKWRRALHLYYRMQEEAVCPDARTFVSVLQSCGLSAENTCNSFVGGEWLGLECLQMGKKIHTEARRRGYDSDVFVGIGMLSMYVKCGSITDAVNVFQSLSQQDVVSWTAMLAGYAQQGEGEKAFQLYHQMREEAGIPNDRTFASLLQACGLGCYQQSAPAQCAHMVPESSDDNSAELLAVQTSC